MVDVSLAEPPSGVDQAAWAAACAAVRGYCGWHIAPEVDEDIVLDGPGGSVLMLPTLHLTGLADVKNAGRPVTDPEWSRAGMVRGSWTTKFRGITATMTHGYEKCPPEVLAIVKDMVKAADLTGAPTVQTGPYSVTYTSTSAGAQAGVVGLSTLQQSVLDRYRIPVAP